MTLDNPGYTKRRRIGLRFDWLLSTASFVVFLAVEAAMLYAYFQWLGNTLQ